MRNVLVVMKLSEKEKEIISNVEGYTYHFFETSDQVPSQLFTEVDTIVGYPSRQLIESCQNVDWIQLPSAGANQYVDIDEKIMITNAYQVYGQSISEYMIASTLAFSKNFFNYYNQQKTRVWKALADMRNISSMKVLGVGMGDIGSNFLKKMHALGSVCYGVRRTIHDQPDYVEKLYTLETMDEILPECDVVALSLPQTQETQNLFDYDRMKKMKKDVIFMNVGRGSAVVTDDLYRLLQEGHFGGVCLDVVNPEPLPLNHPLWTHPKVFITPHVSGLSTNFENRGKVIDVITTNLKNMAQNKQPLHIVDRKLGY